MSVTSADVRRLERLFMHGGSDGRRFVANNITTNKAHTPLADLHRLTRAGLVSYEDEGHFPGTLVRIYRVLLTAKGRELLEAAR